MYSLPIKILFPFFLKVAESLRNKNDIKLPSINVYKIFIILVNDFMSFWEWKIHLGYIQFVLFCSFLFLVYVGPLEMLNDSFKESRNCALEGGNNADFLKTVVFLVEKADLSSHTYEKERWFRSRFHDIGMHYHFRSMVIEQIIHFHYCRLNKLLIWLAREVNTKTFTNPKNEGKVQNQMDTNRNLYLTKFVFASEN